MPRLAAVAGSLVAAPAGDDFGLFASRRPPTVVVTVGKRRPERYDGEVPAAPGRVWQAEALSAQRKGAGSPVRGQSLRGAA